MFMIKTIQLLRESYATYKLNFSNILSIAMPVLVLLLVVAVLDHMTIESSLHIVSVLLGVVFSFLVSLFFQPALYRSIQKLEDTGVFSKAEAYSFQKRNVWNYIVLNFWLFMYAIYINFKYLIIMAVGVVLIIISMTTLPSTAAATVSVVIGIGIAATLIVSIIKNSPKVTLYQNIFFSKDISPRNAVRESLMLGENKGGDIWRIIFSTILLGLAVAVIYVLIYGVFILAGFVSIQEILQMNNKEGEMVAQSGIMFALELIGGLISYAIVTPLMFTIMAKGYKKLTLTSSNPVLAEDAPSTIPTI